MSQNTRKPGRAPVKLGVLDVGAFTRSVQLAPRVEALGYGRYWISEHHGEGSVSNPTLLVPVIAGLTDRMRVGTAGVLLRFQSALAVAENFRMLNRLFAGRIDLGLARSPTGAALTTALYDRRPSEYSETDHAAKVAELQRILCDRLPEGHPLAHERVDPPLDAVGPSPIWVDSTSLDGALLAARIGSSYSFHDHYRPEIGAEAVRHYLDAFQPSPELAQPSWNVAVAGYCARDDADAEDARSTIFGKTPRGRRVIVGTMGHWRDELAALIDKYRTGEVVVQTLGGRYDLERQTASFARIAEAARSLSQGSNAPRSAHHDVPFADGRA